MSQGRSQLDLFGSKTKSETPKKVRQRRRPFDQYQVGDRLIINRSGEREVMVIQWIRHSGFPAFKDLVHVGMKYKDGGFLVLGIYEDGSTLNEKISVEEAPQRKVCDEYQSCSQRSKS